MNKARRVILGQPRKSHPVPSRKSGTGTETQLSLPAKLVHGGSGIRAWWVTALVLFTLLISGCAVASKAVTTTGPTVTGTKTTAAPAIDGKADDAAWKGAKEATITLKAEPGVAARKITLKALYDAHNIYLLATYEDTTPLKIGEAWEYDGTAWRKGSYDDTLAFVWNMNDSIPGFNTRGMGVMTKGLKKGDDVFDFTLTPPNSANASAWQADFWGWCGMPEFYGRGDDMIFKLDKGTALGGLTKTLTVQHDAHLNSTPWVRNEITVNGTRVPQYTYKAGFTIDNTPRPYMDQVEVITDYSAFRAGDRAPFVIGKKGAVWGGSKDDIRTKGTWHNNVFTVEFARALDTGHNDDIRLVPGKSATFVIIVRDDAKGYATSAPVKLTLD